jgi:hypothetical protein
MRSFFHSYVIRIIDNMPVAWCYEVEGEEKPYCSTGFPMGCYVDKRGIQNGACIAYVSSFLDYVLTCNWLASCNSFDSYCNLPVIFL